MRFKIGDRFSKKPFAGFVAEAVALCVIPDYEENQEWAPCMAGCDDVECREFATCEVLNPDGSVDGYLYHVSECQMEPVINSMAMYRRAIVALEKLMPSSGASLVVDVEIDLLATRIEAFEVWKHS